MPTTGGDYFLQGAAEREEYEAFIEQYLKDEEQELAKEGASAAFRLVLHCWHGMVPDAYSIPHTTTGCVFVCPSNVVGGKLRSDEDKLSKQLLQAMESARQNKDATVRWFLKTSFGVRHASSAMAVSAG